MAVNRSAMSTRAVLFSLLASLSICQVARAYTPKSKEVKNMVSRAVSFLGGDFSGAPIMNQVGAVSLVALAVLKARRPKNHPTIVKALDFIKKNAGQPSDNYNTAVAVIFLCELDVRAHRASIEEFIKQMISKQRPDGSWSYHNHDLGDTSQTQYAALCLWYAQKAGFGHLLKSNTVEDMTNWLIRTQDKTGGFGYHPKDPGGFGRIDQSKTRENNMITSNYVDKPSDFSAGMSALLVGADLLKFSSVAAPVEKRDKTIPSELKEIKKKGKKGAARQFAGGKVDKGRLQKAINDGMGWYSKHTAIETNRWQYYFLYGLERFQSYHELITGRNPKEPDWYNKGVAFLQGAQDANDGSWGKGKPGGPAINTAFAILFLMRSTKKTLGSAAFFDDNGLVAKLPKTLGKVGADGTIQEGKRDQDTETLLDALLNNPEDDVVFAVEIPGSSLLSKSEKQRQAQVKKLQQLVRGGSYFKRKAAVKILSTSGKLDDQTVSLIIYALTDPDYRVVNEARDGLRFMSRKLNGFGLKSLKRNSDIKAQSVQLKRTVELWKKWYRSIRPTAKFTVFNEK